MVGIRRIERGLAELLGVVLEHRHRKAGVGAVDTRPTATRRSESPSRSIVVARGSRRPWRAPRRCRPCWRPRPTRQTRGLTGAAPVPAGQGCAEMSSLDLPSSRCQSKTIDAGYRPSPQPSSHSSPTLLVASRVSERSRWRWLRARPRCLAPRDQSRAEHVEPDRAVFCCRPPTVAAGRRTRHATHPFGIRAAIRSAHHTWPTPGRSPARPLPAPCREP